VTTATGVDAGRVARAVDIPAQGSEQQVEIAMHAGERHALTRIVNTVRRRGHQVVDVRDTRHLNDRPCHRCVVQINRTRGNLAAEILISVSRSGQPEGRERTRTRCAIVEFRRLIEQRASAVTVAIVRGAQTQLDVLGRLEIQSATEGDAVLVADGLAGQLVLPLTVKVEIANRETAGQGVGQANQRRR
ncbi:MAG: hypothetical protein RLZ79_2053, partial [Pseudomonadota bacterium]